MSDAHVRAVLDPDLRAELTGLRPLHFAAPDDGADLPGHVRAGSALRRWQGRLAVVQDDVSALALIEVATGDVQALLLPRGHDGHRCFGDDRGNKAHKLDLEAGLVLPDGRLVAFGSGSTAAREQIVVASPSGEVRLQGGVELYAALRNAAVLGADGLNIEGATLHSGRLLLFQRGNADPAAGPGGDVCLALNARAFAAWLDGGPVPAVQSITRFDLGCSPDGARFGFTDAAAMPNGRIAVLAVAEASPDALRDGPVSGCRFGWWSPGGPLRMTDIVDANGRPVRLKLEGIEPWPSGPAEAFHVVADVDDPTVPAMLGELRCRTPPV